MVGVSAIVDEMWAAALVTCLGAFVGPMSVIASPPSVSAAVVPSPAIGSAGGDGECKGVSVSEEGLFWHTVLLGSRECVRDISRVDIAAFCKAVLDS